MRQYTAVGTAVFIMISACGEGTGPMGASIRAELHRLPTTSGTAKHVVGLDRAAARALDWSSDLTITSFETPIRAIWLEGPDDASTMIYECEADSNDGCLVDLAGPALQDLLGATPQVARQGTYLEVAVSTCEDEGEYTAYLTGSLTLNSQTHVTRTVGVLGTDSTAQPVAIVFSGCRRTYPVPTPLVVSDSVGEEIAFKLYFDIRDLAWGSLGGSETASGWIPGGCAGPRPESGSADSPYLCAGYPDVAGVVDDTAPVIERYRINDGATIGLIFQAANGAFIGGFTRRFFAAGSQASPGFSADTPVEIWTDNGNGTYRLATYGASSDGGGPEGHMLLIEAFVRDDHTGTATAHGGSQFQYTVVRLD